MVSVDDDFSGVVRERIGSYSRLFQMNDKSRIFALRAVYV